MYRFISSPRPAGGFPLTEASGAEWPPPAKIVLAVLGPAPRLPETSLPRLVAAFGPIDYTGPAFPFDFTAYYEPEFGAGLWRFFLSFRGIADPAGLPGWKKEAGRIEGEWSVEGRRAWNLDAGYLDPDKLVLGSLKRGPHKLYLGDGVFGDMLLKYAGGRFHPLPWSFADFRDGRYERSLLVIREKLKADMKKNPLRKP